MFSLLTSILPSLVRFVQCLRRYYDHRYSFLSLSIVSDVHPHLYNAAKYFMSLVAHCFSWNPVCFGIFQSMYTFYALGWDLREDWGKKKSEFTNRFVNQLDQREMVSATRQLSKQAFAGRDLLLLHCNPCKCVFAFYVGCETRL